MTTRVDFQTETADVLLARAQRFLRQGDLLKASEKGWDTTEQMVKAAAESRGWPHSSPEDLYRVIDRLANELGDDQLRLLFRSAKNLHQNAYDDFMPEGFVVDALHNVEAITTRLKAAVR